MKKKILLSAFACDPVTGSEPYVGWNWALMLADDYDVHVITRSYSRALIDGHSEANKLTFHFADYFGTSKYNHQWRFIKLYYVIWQALVVFKVISLQARHSFALIHHVTYNNIDVPGFLWLVPQTQFVWGPVGGGQVAPRSLAKVYGKRWWKECVRGVLKASARYNPVVRGAISRASIVLLANQETADRMAGLRFRSKLISETAISLDGLADPTDAPRREGPVRVLWLGYVFARKGLVLAVEGFKCALESESGLPDIELVVAGDGEGLEIARQLAERIGVADRISFLGAIPHSEVRRQLKEADVFLFTSVQDTSGNVLLEAMREAKPIIALNHQGAKALVTGGGARLVEIGTYSDTVRGIGSAIVELARDSVLRQTMGRANLREVRERHTWTAKRTQILEIYQDIISGSQTVTRVDARSAEFA
jgi:glycosyltransferase involved in cell wall biosynthesis